MNSETEQQPRVVVIGGGTGSLMLLSQLKRYAPNITALVNMVDDGGSTGLLRDELAVLPPGDIRQCLVALSDAPQQLRDLFSYRFSDGGLTGHSFGNLFLSAAEKMSGSFEAAVLMASDVLQVQGTVLPITLDDCQLVMNLNEQETVGESTITDVSIPNGAQPVLHLKPNATINPKAAAAITSADMVVIAPGSLYNSLIPALIVDGVAEALKHSKAKIVFVCNLVNKGHQSNDFTVNDYVQALEQYIGQGVIQYVIYNKQLPDSSYKEQYEADGQTLVGADEAQFIGASYQPIPGDFLSKQAPAEKSSADRVFANVQRNLVRHDADAVSQALMKLCAN